MNVYLKVAVISLIAFMPVAAMSQDSSASISGTVYGPNGETVADAPIQMTNTVTDNYQRVRSDANVDFEMAGLSAGSYTLTINPPCCTYNPYASEDIEIATSEARALAIRLDQGMSIGTIGDDPNLNALAIRGRQEIPDLPVPRMPDENPDFLVSGYMVLWPTLNRKNQRRIRGHRRFLTSVRPTFSAIIRIMSVYRATRRPRMVARHHSSSKSCKNQKSWSSWSRIYPASGRYSLMGVHILTMSIPAGLAIR